jgi:hypothetical protein
MELLIKAQDANAPSLSEWKDNLNNVILPQATAFFTRWPEAENVKTKIAEVRAAESAIATIAAATAGKPVSTEDQTKAASTLLNYVPPTPLEKSRIEFYNTPTNPDTMLPLALGEKVQHEGYPILVHHDYYKNQVEVESLKSDAVKQAELDEQDRMCHKMGDPITIKPNGFKWTGLSTCPPKFIRVSVPDADEKEYAYLVESVIEQTMINEIPIQKMILRHRWNIDISKLQDGDVISASDFDKLLSEKVR